MKVPTNPRKNAPPEIPTRSDVEYVSFRALNVFCSSAPPSPGTQELCCHMQYGAGQFCGVFPILQTSKVGMPNPTPSPASFSSCPSLQVLVNGFHAQTVSIPSPPAIGGIMAPGKPVAVAPLHAAIVLCIIQVAPSLPSSPMPTTTHRRNCADHPQTPSYSAVLSAESP